MTEMICITCPTGCKLQAELTDGVLALKGNSCKRGEAFALAELTNPMRSLCSTVRAGTGMLPVRTDREIPKGKIFEVMELLRGLEVHKSITCGGMVSSLEPICDGNMIATCDFTI